MNNKREYKKTWKPFVFLFLIYLILMFTVSIVAHENGANSKITTALTLLICDLWLLALMFVIYKGQYVYWINGGPDFDTAYAAGASKRKVYALKHLKRFAVILIPVAVFLVLSIFFSWSLLITVTFFAIAVIAAAFSTINIKFDDDKS